MNASALRREWTACGAILRAAYFMRANQGSNWLSGVFIGLALLIPVVALALKAPWRAALGLGAAVPLVVVALIWWSMLLLSLATQGSVPLRLVPRLRQRRVAVLLGAWSAATVGLAALFALGGAPALLVAVVIGLVLACLAMMVVAPHIGIPTALLLAGSTSAAPSADLVIRVGALCILGIGLIVVRSIYLGVPVGAAMLGNLIGATGVLGARQVPSHYARILQRDCMQGRIGALLLHGVGPAAFPAPGLTKFGLFLAAAALLAVVLPGWLVAQGLTGRLFLVVPIVFTQLGMCFRVAAMVRATTGEQALVRLSARAPAGTAFNGPLARALLQQFAYLWMGSTVILLAFCAALGADAAELLRLALVCSMSLTGAGMLLRDYAANRAASFSANAYGAWVLGACVMTLQAAGGLQRIEFWWGLGVVALAVALVCVRQRWNAMLRAPAAFPAARGR
jgi:hypothetical protein